MGRPVRRIGRRGANAAPAMRRQRIDRCARRREVTIMPNTFGAERANKPAAAALPPADAAAVRYLRLEQAERVRRNGRLLHPSRVSTPVRRGIDRAGDGVFRPHRHRVPPAHAAIAILLAIYTFAIATISRPLW